MHPRQLNGQATGISGDILIKTIIFNMLAYRHRPMSSYEAAIPWEHALPSVIAISLKNGIRSRKAIPAFCSGILPVLHALSSSSSRKSEIRPHPQEQRALETPPALLPPFSFSPDTRTKIDTFYFYLPDIHYIHKNLLAFHAKKTY